MLKLNRTAAGCSLLAFALYAPPASAQCAQWSNSLGNFTEGHPRDVILFDAGDGQGPTLWIAWTVSASDALGDGGVRRRVGNLWYETESNIDERGAAALAVYDDGAGAQLYAGGDGGVRRLVNGTWEQLGPIYDLVHELAVVDLGAGPELYAGCFNSNAGNPVVKRVGNSWVPVGAGMSPMSRITGLVAFDSGAGPELYACGEIALFGSFAPIVKLGPGGWSAVPMPSAYPPAHAPKDIVVHDDGSGPRLVVAYRTYGGTTLDVHLYDGSTWTTIPSPLGTWIDTPVAFALESHDEYGSGQKSLFVGGNFRTTNGSIEYLARLQGTTWSALGSGVLDPMDYGVRMLKSLPMQPGWPQTLVVGGRFDVAGGLEAIRLATWEACPAGVVSCAGDGGGTPCPCGNDGAPGAGCTNSLFYGGTLRAEGLASVTADSLTLIGEYMPDSSALYFQGTAAANGGAGVVFGDGLRCAVGTTTRLATKMNAGGSSQLPDAGDPSISLSGQIPAAGGERHYQVWYRNSASFCTGATFNLTNSLRVQWYP